MHRPHVRKVRIRIAQSKALACGVERKKKSLVERKQALASWSGGVREQHKGATVLCSPRLSISLPGAKHDYELHAGVRSIVLNTWGNVYRS